MTNEKRKSPSGLRCVATLQTLARDAKPRERHQLANRFARLENERARLEREIGIWETRLQATTKQLSKVRADIDSLRLLLDNVPAQKDARRISRGQCRASGSTNTPGQSSVRNRTMQLGY